MFSMGLPLTSFLLAEMRIGLTEEFCVGKSELRGERKWGFLSVWGLLPAGLPRDPTFLSGPQATGPGFEWTRCHSIVQCS